jgi:hypothetical protein
LTGGADIPVCRLAGKNACPTVSATLRFLSFSSI